MKIENSVLIPTDVLNSKNNLDIILNTYFYLRGTEVLRHLKTDFKDIALDEKIRMKVSVDLEVYEEDL